MYFTIKLLGFHIISYLSYAVTYTISDFRIRIFMKTENPI